jgi:hypothetical protein
MPGRPYSLLIATLFLVFAPLTGPGAGVPDESSADDWSGTYRYVSMHAGSERPTGETRGNVSLTKEADGYHLGLKPYRDFVFREVKPGVLEAPKLGKIIRGALVFEDAASSQRVLRVDLCYEHFLLFRLPSDVPVKPPAGQGRADRDRLVTSVAKAVGPTYIIKLYETPATSNFLYRIDVCDATGARVLQSLTLRNGVPLRPQDRVDAFQVLDVDGDGFADIKVLGGLKDGKAWYKIWLYDPAAKQFVWSQKDR